MSDENPAVPPGVGDLDPEDVTLEAELAGRDAEREIDKAVRGRHGIARKYVRWVRRRNPDATPAEIISMLERHYVTAIRVARVPANWTWLRVKVARCSIRPRKLR